MKTLQRNILLVGFVALLCSAVAFAEWSQWRGANRDGVLAEFSTPEVWPEQLRKVWSVEVGGGDSSPVVSGKRVYVHTRQGKHDEVVTAIDLDSGRILWQDSYSGVFHKIGWTGAESRDRGPFSTPTLHEEELYTFGVTQALSAYDAETGNLIWRKDFAKQFSFGASTSPIVVDGYCIVLMGEYDKGELTAYDATTGEIAWRWNEDAPSYSSPILTEFAGTKQLVAVTRKNCIGVSPATGEIFWKIPFIHPWEENIATPVRYGDTIIVSNVEGTRAIRVSKNGDNWLAEEIWHNPDAPTYTGSPVLSGDLLYGFSNDDGGKFYCLDPRTGKTVWTSDGRQGEHASIVSAGEFLFCLTGDAELIVVNKSAKGFEPIARYTVADGPTWAHPVILGRQLLIKDNSMLTLWSVEQAASLLVERAASPLVERTASPLVEQAASPLVERTTSPLVEQATSPLVDTAPPDVTHIPHSEQPATTTIETTTELKTIIWEKDGTEMALIPAGEFQMGSNHGDIDERPIHTVYLDAFYIDKYEVTNARYKEFISTTGYPTPKNWSDPKNTQPDRPVDGVTWHDAMAYAEWAGKRLPTEAEWEKAARGGLVGKQYPWGDEAPHGQGQYRANYDFMKQDVMPVGSFPPNGYGLYDMAGNVFEWCLDEYQEDYYASSPKNNPLAGGSLTELLMDYKNVKTIRVLRGGAWDLYDNLIRCANRFKSEPTGAGGFRCVSSRVP